MKSEIRLAFEHPIARSEAAAPELPDRISLRDHIVEVDIGAFQQERGKTQRIRFNVVVEVRPAAEISDDVDRILSYDKVSEAIAVELAKERFNLLETLAERVAERILFEPQALRAFIRIEKLDRGPGLLGIEIVRSSKDQAQKAGKQKTGGRQPQIVCLSNDAICSVYLKHWLDSLSSAGIPSVLCVDAPRERIHLTQHPMVDRRIKLLAIEQNAWILASKDDRCVVVSTKTELDWAVKQNKLCVWAPSKMVLDCKKSPKPPVRDTLALAVWLAGPLNANRVFAVGNFESQIDDSLIQWLPVEAFAF